MIDVFKAMKEVYPQTEEGLETYAINMFAEWDNGRFAFAQRGAVQPGYWESGQQYFIDYFIPTGEINSIFDDDSAFKRACHFLFELNQAAWWTPTR